MHVVKLSKLQRIATVTGAEEKRGESCFWCLDAVFTAVQLISPLPHKSMCTGHLSLLSLITVGKRKLIFFLLLDFDMSLFGHG